MKEYTARYDGLYFEFSVPDGATKKDIEKEVNRILRTPDELMECVKKAFKSREEYYLREIEYYKKTAETYEKLYKLADGNRADTWEDFMKQLNQNTELSRMIFVASKEDTI